MMNIGFIGLGKMGSGMASNILKAGYPLTVYDVRLDAAKQLIEAGAVWADTPEALAQQCEIICSSLPGPKEVEDIALGRGGLIEGIRRGTAYIDLSTNSPTLMRRIYAAYKEKSSDVLDSPVSGGPEGARTGKLVLMVGGDEAVFQKCKPVLSAIGQNVVYTGKIGSGSICKLMHNAIIFGINGIIAECLTAGVKAGVEPKALWQAINGGAAGRGLIFTQVLPSAYLEGRFDPPHFALNLAFKDLNLATLVGRDFNVPMPIAETVRQDMITAINRGLGDKDFTAALLVQEARAGGVEVRIPGVGGREI
jgi:3-hydroxyisobutyrate dehydrogenase